MQVAAMDFATAMLGKAVMYHGEQVKEGLTSLEVEMRNKGETEVAE
jgi:hypothetical protein